MSTSTVTIRPIGPDDDADAVGGMVQRGYFALPDYPHDPEYDAEVADVAARMQRAEVIVAEVDGSIVGCLTYVGDWTSPDAEHGDPEAATFRCFAVDPDAQGLGVGASMVRWVLDRARRDGKARLRIHTLEAMVGAIAMYERFGFVRDPDHDGMWDGVLGLAYRFDL